MLLLVILFFCNCCKSEREKSPNILPIDSSPIYYKIELEEAEYSEIFFDVVNFLENNYIKKDVEDALTTIIKVENKMFRCKEDYSNDKNFLDIFKIILEIITSDNDEIRGSAIFLKNDKVKKSVYKSIMEDKSLKEIDTSIKEDYIENIFKYLNSSDTLDKREKSLLSIILDNKTIAKELSKHFIFSVEYPFWGRKCEHLGWIPGYFSKGILNDYYKQLVSELDSLKSLKVYIKNNSLYFRNVSIMKKLSNFGLDIKYNDGKFYIGKCLLELKKIN